MSIRYDLSGLLLPLPDQFTHTPEPATDMVDVGRAITVRQLSSHPDAQLSGELAFRSARNMWSPANGVHAAHRAIIRWRNQRGFIRLVPDDEALAPYNGLATDVNLLNGFRIPVEELLEHDRRATLVLSSPNGISGRIGTVQEIVRLARHFALVVIDERLTGFSSRRLTPLASEWENVLTIQQFPFIMPGQTQDFAWIIHPPEHRGELSRYLAPLPPETVEEALAYGTMNTHAAERYTARLKGQLWREMRKMSILSVPYPSWSNSLLARIERGTREQVVQGLAERGIAVHVPPQDNLRRHIRITAVSNEATMALREALVDINREL